MHKKFDIRLFTKLCLIHDHTVILFYLLIAHLYELFHKTAFARKPHAAFDHLLPVPVIQSGL